MTLMLQKKFIRTAMIAVTLLIAVFLVGTGVVNAYSSATDASATLDAIMAREAFSRPDFSPADGGQEENAKEASPPSLPPEMTPEKEDALASQRYFFVRTTSEGKVIYTDLRNISSVDEAIAKTYVEEIASSGKKKGRLHGYLYKVETSDASGGYIYAFLDERRVISANIRTVIISLVIGAVVWVLMLILVIFLSKKAIRPIAESLEKQNRFISDAGHEFKTPLAIIRANAEVLELHMGGSKWLTNIKNQVDRLTLLTTNLLTLTKMEEGPDVIPPETFDAAGLLMETLRPYEASFSLKNISVLVTGRNTGISFHFRRDWYTQLLTILFDNAVKYAAEDTDYRIAIASGTCDAEMTGELVSGHGSSPASPSGVITLVLENVSAAPLTGDPERLFDRFYRADEARTQKSGGSGIGLSVARAITDHADGTITCTYLPDNRIRFTIILKSM